MDSRVAIISKFPGNSDGLMEFLRIDFKSKSALAPHSIHEYELFWIDTPTKPKISITNLGKGELRLESDEGVDQALTKRVSDWLQGARYNVTDMEEIPLDDAPPVAQPEAPEPQKPPQKPGCCIFL